MGIEDLARVVGAHELEHPVAALVRTPYIAPKMVVSSAERSELA